MSLVASAVRVAVREQAQEQHAQMPAQVLEARAQQIGSDLVDCALVRLPSDLSFQEAKLLNTQGVLRYLRQNPIYDLIPGRRIEDVSLPVLAERIFQAAQSERRAQIGLNFSDDYHEGFSTLGRDVRQHVLPNPEEHCFQAPRPGTSDLQEQNALLRVMGYVGVQQMATTGHTDVLRLYLANLERMTKSVPEFSHAEVHSGQVLRYACAILAIADAVQGFESNARFRDMRLKAIFSERTLIEEQCSVFFDSNNSNVLEPAA